MKIRLSTLLARRSFTLLVSSSILMRSVPKKIWPSRMTTTSSASSLSASGMGVGLFTLAISTLWPFCNMGVMTMKMMSSTSITSTMGVTLMLELTLLPSLRNASAISSNSSRLPLPANLTALQEIVDQLARAVIHFHVEGFHLAGEVVEHHDGRNGDEQSDSGGHQGFGNAARDRAQTGSLLARNFLEGVQNADHGAEQPDERGGGTDGSQPAQAALQLGVNDGFGTLEGALGGFDLLAGNVGGIAMGLELLEA